MTDGAVPVPVLFERCNVRNGVHEFWVEQGCGFISPIEVPLWQWFGLSEAGKQEYREQANKALLGAHEHERQSSRPVSEGRGV